MWTSKSVVGIVINASFSIEILLLVSYKLLLCKLHLMNLQILSQGCGTAVV